MRVLLVEDEKRIALAVAEVMRKQHLAVDVVFDGVSGYDYALTGQYDVVVLDIMLPGMDGIAVTKLLRQQHIQTPVILLTALGSIEDKVRGLDAGADDYLVKPFATAELMARIRALSRRAIGLDSDGLQAYGDLVFSPQSLIASSGAAEAALSVKAAQLLELLLANRGSIVSKDTILVKLWGYDSNADANHVEVHISQLRKALEKLGTAVSIRTVRGIGYSLVAGSLEQE